MADSPLLLVISDAVHVLAAAGVPHALIGGVAAILYGSTRATRDVDMAVRVAPQAARRALETALETGGFAQVESRGAVIQARHSSGYRLDLLVAHSEFERDIIQSAKPRAVPNGPVVPLALLPDVIAFKLVGGRPRDLRDIEELVESNEAVNWKRVSELLELLGVVVPIESWQEAVDADDLRGALKGVVARIRG